MIDYIGMLTEFHSKFDHHMFDGYAPEADTVELRIKLIQEEVNDELIPLLEQLKFPSSISKDQWDAAMVLLADALGDSLYVIFGTCLTYGIPIDAVFAEIHRSNMTKSMIKDLKSIKGKTTKGTNFEPPNLKPIIEEALR